MPLENLPPDPNHIPQWLETLMRWGEMAFIFVFGLLLGTGKWIAGRHINRADADKEAIGDLKNRLSVLESRPAYVTLPELRLAISEALAEASKLFTPQHEALAHKSEEAIRASKLETQNLITECNGAIRRDLGLSIDELRREVVPALDRSTEAVMKSAIAVEQSTKLMNDVISMMKKLGMKSRA